MKRLTILFVFLAASFFFFFGCSEKKLSKKEWTEKKMKENGSVYAGKTMEYTDRFSVTEVGAFENASTFSKKSRIFIIKDSHTGAEYIGISGVGITSLGDSVHVRRRKGPDEIKYIPIE